jgi:hypothetical protein
MSKRRLNLPIETIRDMIKGNEEEQNFSEISSESEKKLYL